MLVLGLASRAELGHRRLRRRPRGPTRAGPRGRRRDPGRRRHRRAGARGRSAREPFPVPTDLGWAAIAGVCGLVGITSLYRGLAVGRMGVVAPTTGVLSAVIPVVAGLRPRGRPAARGGRRDRRRDRRGRAGDAGARRRSGPAVGGQLGAPRRHRDRRLQRLRRPVLRHDRVRPAGADPARPGACSLGTILVAARQPWRMPRDVPPKLVVIGLLDMTGNATFILATQAGALAIAACCRRSTRW